MELALHNDSSRNVPKVPLTWAQLAPYASAASPAI